MPSPREYIRRLLFERAARRAAKAAFRRTYPHDRARWTRVIRRDEDGVVVAVGYRDKVMMMSTPPNRFFRVSRAELAAAECGEPPDWGRWF